MSLRLAGVMIRFSCCDRGAASVVRVSPVRSAFIWRNRPNTNRIMMMQNGRGGHQGRGLQGPQAAGQQQQGRRPPPA